MVKMIATKPICGDGYRADEGQPFTVDERKAEILEAKGLARRHVERKAMSATPENKMLQPVENKSAEPSYSVTIKPRQRQRHA